MKAIPTLLLLLATSFSVFGEELVRPEVPAAKIAVEENTILGIPEKDFVQTQAALTEAAATAEVAKLTADLEKLIEARDDLMFAVATKLHPERTAALKTLAAATKEKKKLRGPATQ
jgi:hypothetical protein